jgi:hypothetical protein
VIINDYAPFTGFGDDYSASVKFAILHPDEMFPQWSSAHRSSKHAIPGSNVTVTQYHGRAPWSVTLRLYFASIDELEALDQLVGRKATLRYMWGISKTVGGYKWPIEGQNYLVLPGTILDSMSDERYEIDGPAEATVRFERSYDPSLADTYGFAEYAEDE